MSVPLPTMNQMAAFGRHVVTYASGITTAVVALHLVGADQGAQITDAIGQIVDGVKTTVGGVATLVAILSGLYASWTASPKSQLMAVAANPDVKKIVTDSAVAAATPSDKVVSK